MAGFARTRVVWVVVALATALTMLALEAGLDMAAGASGEAGEAPVVQGPPNLYPRYKPCAVVLNGKIYLVGGRGSTVKNPPTEVFDPSTGVWTAFGPESFPEAGYGACAASVGGKIYVFGGKNDAGRRVKTARVFDEATGSWSVVPGEATMGHNDACLAVVGTKVYLFGGEDDSLKNEGLDYSSAVDVFDAATGTWSVAGKMPLPRQDFWAVTWRNTIFVMGGQGGPDDSALDNLEAFEPEAGGVWHLGMSLPYTWEHPRAVTIGDKIYLLTGKGEGGAFIFEFDPVTKEFEEMPSTLIEPRNECAVVELGGKIYVIGGRNAAGDVLSSMEIYDPALDK